MLFSLHPFAVKPIEKLGGKANLVYLPDLAPFIYSIKRRLY
jgi:hypothetical protein